MKRRKMLTPTILACIVVAAGSAALVGHAQQATNQPPSSYMPVVAKEPFEQTMARMSAAKAGIMKRQMDLLEERYDLADRPAQGVTMSRGKAVQEGVRVKLPDGMTWEQLAAMSPRGDPREGPLAGGLLSAAAPQPPRGRDGLSASRTSTRSRSRRAAT